MWQPPPRSVPSQFGSWRLSRDFVPLATVRCLGGCCYSYSAMICKFPTPLMRGFGKSKPIWDNHWPFACEEVRSIETVLFNALSLINYSVNRDQAPDRMRWLLLPPPPLPIKSQCGRQWFTAITDIPTALCHEIGWIYFHTVDGWLAGLCNGRKG